MEAFGNINDPSYELLLRRRLGGSFSVRDRYFDEAEAREQGFGDGDVIALDEAAVPPLATVARLRRAEAYELAVSREDPEAFVQACWEIGNIHAPLYKGKSSADALCVLTPITPLTEGLFEGNARVRVSKVQANLEEAERFSSKVAEATVAFAKDFKINKL